MTDYVDEAMEMIGKGYDHPTIVIDPPSKRTERHNGRMVEVDEPAWVKFSTGFKQELADLDEHSLKVFIYIGLSVNWQTGEACPGVRKIAEETKMNKDTVMKAVSKLEEKGFLGVQKRVGNSNTYKPMRYISIGTVRPCRTVVSDGGGEVSDETPEVSDASRVNLHNKNNKNELDIVDVYLIYNKPTDTIRKAITDNFPFNVNWEAKFSRQWLEWACSENITSDQIRHAAETWKMDKQFNWQQPTLKLIFEKWPALMKSSNPQTEPSEYVTL